MYSLLGWALHLLAIMPWWVIYLHADLLYFVAYYVIGYRKKVVLLHISDDDMRRRMVFHNAGIIEDAFNNGQSIVLYAAHYGNWEWVTSVTLWFNSAAHSDAVQGQVYQPLENEWFDRFFLRLRQRFNTVCISQRVILREMISREREGRHLGIGFIADRKLHCRAAFFDVRKLSRGHYECTLVPLSDDIAAEPYGSVTTRYARLLERRIEAEPAYWLWTHKRWKRPVTFPDGYNKENELEFYTRKKNTPSTSNN